MSAEFSSDFRSFERRALFDLESRQFSMALSTDGQILVTGGEDRTIRMWNTQTGQLVRYWSVAPLSMNRDENRIYSLSLSHDKQVLVSGGSVLQAWDIATGGLIRSLKGGNWALYTALSPDRKILVTYGEEKTVVWNLSTGKKIRRRIGDNDGIETIVITPNGEYLIGGDSFDHSIKVWKLKTGQMVRKFASSSAVKVRRLALSPDNRLLAGSGFDGVQFWDYVTGTPGQTINKFENLRFHEHLDNVTCPVFNSDGRLLLSCGGDGLVQIWNTATGKNMSTLQTQHRVSSLALSADDRTLVTHSRMENIVEVWRID